MLNSPLFGVIISLLCYILGIFIYRKTKLPVFNPLLIAITLIIIFLSFFNIRFESYYQGGSLIEFFLAPATVCLAIPLYKQIDLLKKHLFPIIMGVLIGSITAITTTIALAKIIGLNEKILYSLVPRSVTTPIAMAVSDSLGGKVPITILAVIVTGIIGSILGPITMELFRVRNKVAKGLGIGTASHAVGTSKAIEMGEIEGAMSGLAIAIAGIFTVFLAPLMVKIFL